MAVALPIIAIAGGAMGVSAGVAAGLTAIGVATAIAGGAAMVSGVAALAGKPRVAKIAGLVSLGAGAFAAVAGLAGSASSAATPAAEAAGAAAPGEAADSFIGSALEGSRGNTAVIDNAASAGSTIAEQTSTASNLTEAATSSLVQPTASSSLAAPDASSLASNPLTANPMAEYGGAMGQGTPAAQAAKSPSLFDRVSELGKFARDNKELLNLAGGALDGAFGPEQQMVDLRERQLDMTQEEIDRRNRNANNIVGLRPGLYFNAAARPGVRS